MSVFQRLSSLYERLRMRAWRGEFPPRPRGRQARRYWERLDDGAREAFIGMAGRHEVTTEPELALLLQDLVDQEVAQLWRGIGWFVVGAVGLLAAVVVLLGFVFEQSLGGALAGAWGFVGGGGGLVAVLWRADRARRKNAETARAAGLLG